MSPKAFQHLQVDLDLTQRQMARMMDVAERTVFDWKTNGVEGGPAGLLLALLARGKITPQDLWDLRLEYERMTADASSNPPATL
jgi:DNA-binding transcriptional regulator YiaG